MGGLFDSLAGFFQSQNGEKSAAHKSIEGALQMGAQFLKALGSGGSR